MDFIPPIGEGCVEREEGGEGFIYAQYGRYPPNMTCIPSPQKGLYILQNDIYPPQMDFISPVWTLFPHWGRGVWGEITGR